MQMPEGMTGANPSTGEVPGRLARLRARMGEGGFDALLLMSPENVYYASGALIHTQSLIRRRQAVVVLPAVSPPSLIVCPIERGLAQRVNQLPELLTYREFEEPAVQRSADCLVAAKLGGATIGIETTYMPQCDYEVLRAALPHARLVACDGLLQAVRSRKSAAELDAMRFAAWAMDRAISEAAAATGAGASEEELAARITANALGLGGGRFRSAVGLVAAGPNLRVSHHVAGPKRLQPGEVLRIGCRAVYEGYHGLVARTGVVGNAPEAIGERYRRLRTAHADLLASLVPGARAGAIYERAADRRAALRLDLTTSHVGHGIGLEFQELPALRRGNPDELGPGMTLVAVSVAPDPDAGYLYLEDMVAVEQGSARLLSDSTQTEAPLLIGR